MDDSEWDQISVATVIPARERKQEQDRQQDKDQKQQPRYHVILWDDPDHSYDYVITLMRDLFRFPETKVIASRKKSIQPAAQFV